VGRSPILESLEHVAKLLLNLLIVELHQGKDLVLQFRDIDTYTPTTNFITVTNHVVLLCTHLQRIYVKQTHMLIVHTRERIVLRIIALQILIVVEEREVYD